MNGDARIRLQMGGALLTAVLTLGGCATSGDVDGVRRDVAALRQEVAGLAKSNEAARALTEERLGRLEKDLRGRMEAALKEGEGSRVALNTRLEELGTETRFVQGKLEENASALRELQTRLDEVGQQAQLARRRGDALDQ